MIKTLNNRTQKIILLFSLFALLILFVFTCFIINNIKSSECYVGNYDEYICYDGEMYYKICDENKVLFSEEFYNNYQEYSISNITELDERTVDIKGINTFSRFLTENVRVIYNNSDHNEIVFLTLEHFPGTINEYAKPNKYK